MPNIIDMTCSCARDGRPIQTSWPPQANKPITGQAQAGPPGHATRRDREPRRHNQWWQGESKELLKGLPLRSGYKFKGWQLSWESVTGDNLLASSISQGCTDQLTLIWRDDTRTATKAASVRLNAGLYIWILDDAGRTATQYGRTPVSLVVCNHK